MASEVLRKNGTVLRPASDSSAFMAALLKTFEQQNFTGAPKFLGQVDDKDMFTFIPGDVPKKFRPWSDDQVGAAARLLRQMHDATRGSELAGRFDVVCHHDPGPNNAVFQNDTPVAFIDFEQAAPGGRLEDVAYMAWTWSISSKQTMALVDQAAQVRLIADTYGLHEVERHALTDCVLERQSRNVRFWAELAAHPETAPAGPEVLADRIAWSRREQHFVYAHREVFDRALA
ncbi:phosphotransferase family protein [Nonomuraea sp. NPDC049646]|uniref:phosphotransferase family protein n=1 Tax=unclassified Nonomuraea TaxID=2593643 RepID=UPI0037A72977